MTTQPIPGFDGYLATDHGIIISRHGRALSTYRDKDGYFRVNLASDRGKGARRFHRGVHQLVCLAFHGPRPEGMEVSHVDGQPDNNHPANLRYCTHLQNIRDKHAHGTMPHGNSHPMAKLNSDIVEQIRFYIAMGMNNMEIGRMFEVNNSTVSLIRVGKTWRLPNAA